MLIITLVCLFAIIALFIGGYLFTHRTRQFLIFKPQDDPTLSKVVTFWGIEMILIGIFCLIAAIIDSTLLIVIAIVLGCFSGTIMALTLMTFLKLKP